MKSIIQIEELHLFQKVLYNNIPYKIVGINAYTESGEPTIELQREDALLFDTVTYNSDNWELLELQDI